MIEVFRQANGLLMVSVGTHCAEMTEDDEAAISALADRANVSAVRIVAAITRYTMETL